MLGPGSDYLDLFHILPQACTNLIGTAGITAADCQEVTKAVTATEMNSSRRLRAHISRHRFATVRTCCKPRCSPTTWRSTTATGLVARHHLAESGATSPARHRAARDRSSPRIETSFLLRRFKAPSTSRCHRVSHISGLTTRFELEADSGDFLRRWSGRVQRQRRSIVDRRRCIAGTINGYNGVLESGFGNPLAKPIGLLRPEPWYQTTRINLSSLAGSSVRFRFRLSSDVGNFFGATGWFIDDVKFYTCGLPGPPMKSLVPARLLESRPELSTIDGQFNGIGVRGAGSVTVLPVVGRGGVGGDAAAVVLNVTVTDAQAAGFVTVYPCGAAQSDGVEFELCGWFDGGRMR